MIVRIVGRRVGREAARRAMLEPLVDRQDDQLAGAAEAALHQDAGEIRLGAGIVALVVGEDLLNCGGELHGRGPRVIGRRSNAGSAERVHTALAKGISIRPCCPAAPLRGCRRASRWLRATYWGKRMISMQGSIRRAFGMACLLVTIMTSVGALADDAVLAFSG